MSNYKNPVPHFGGKTYAIQLVFDFPEWTEKEEAKKRWKNGLPKIVFQKIVFQTLLL